MVTATCSFQGFCPFCLKLDYNRAREWGFGLRRPKWRRNWKPMLKACGGVKVGVHRFIQHTLRDKPHWVRLNWFSCEILTLLQLQKRPHQLKHEEGSAVYYFKSIQASINCNRQKEIEKNRTVSSNGEILQYFEDFQMISSTHGFEREEILLISWNWKAFDVRCGQT